MTGFSFAGYESVLIVWGIVRILFGSDLVYLLVRYFVREDAEAETKAPIRSEATSEPAHGAPVERELVAAGH